MFLKLEVAEERQTVIRCGGFNWGSVLQVAASALEEVVCVTGRLVALHRTEQHIRGS